ncbi:MAG: hypothetical protein WA447_05420 [Candidatus Binatus sp.]|uniref:hypothetical protein n=1 Tax=Candidatus Binatus sp. TaxID=2811406 RepID=UPI003BB006AB
MVAAVAVVGTLWTSVAMATITQGDFSVFGFFETRVAGHWGEGSSSRDSTPTTIVHPTVTSSFAIPGKSFGITGGSFDFNHWDLAEQRNLADVRPDYHMVKNYKLLGRFDTLLIKDADFFAYYRPWYDSFGSLKNHGRERPNTDVTPYSQNDSSNNGVFPVHSLQNDYFKNDLREWYAQLNFTDNFSARIGKQQIIWSEADALSGTEVTNPVNATWHGVYGAEAAEDVRTNLRMIKLNYILPDFLKTANNELEAFIIPGDFEAAQIITQADPRNPYVVPVALDGGCQTCGSGPDSPFPVDFNQNGQKLNVSEVPNGDPKGMIFLPIGPVVGGKASGQFYDFYSKNLSHTPSNSLENSEFGARYSTLLPIGNGLQTSFIYLYEFRSALSETCAGCTAKVTGEPGAFAVAPGTFVIPGFFLNRPRRGVLVGGTVEAVSTTDYRRNHFIGLTGTYYDKDLTDIVYRYDILYQPKTSISVPATVAARGAEWTEFTRWIIAGDRPTYIPWISKQHTFLTAQFTETWYPDRPPGAVPQVSTNGKVRELSSLAFINATNWLMNGQLTAGNLILWDIDDNVGELATTNVYRYSRNVLLGVNAQWFLGRSGRYTDPYLLSRQQRFNELEFTFTYEI